MGLLRECTAPRAQVVWFLLSFAVGAGSWCSGLTCQPVTLEIAGSNPVGPATLARTSSALVDVPVRQVHLVVSHDHLDRLVDVIGEGEDGEVLRADLPL